MKRQVTQEHLSRAMAHEKRRSSQTAPASKAKCGFHKHTDDLGDYYTLKTVFPFPEKVNDNGVAGL